MSLEVGACEPMRPEVTPPNKVGEDFVYDYYTAEEQVADDFKSAKDIAVATVEYDIHSEARPRDAITKLKLRYGWGQSQGRIFTTKRLDTSCGAPDKLIENGLYVVIFKGGELGRIFPIESVKIYIDKLGDPEYKYTNVGIVY
jgi:hypothetical protein